MGGTASREEEAEEVEWPDGAPAPEVLAGLPPEMRTEIMLQVPPKSIRAACAMNRAFAHVCTPTFLERHARAWMWGFSVGRWKSCRFVDGGEKILCVEEAPGYPIEVRVGTAKYPAQMLEIQSLPDKDFVFGNWRGFKSGSGFVTEKGYFDGVRYHNAGFPRRWYMGDTFGERGVVGVAVSSIVVYAGPPYDPMDALLSVRIPELEQQQPYVKAYVGGDPPFLAWNVADARNMHFVDLQSGEEFAQVELPAATPEYELEWVDGITESGWIVLRSEGTRGGRSTRSVRFVDRHGRYLEPGAPTDFVESVQTLHGNRVAIFTSVLGFAIWELTYPRAKLVEERNLTEFVVEKLGYRSGVWDVELSEDLTRALVQMSSDEYWIVYL